MADSQPHTPPVPLPAGEFWDAYFSNRFEQGARAPTGSYRVRLSMPPEGKDPFDTPPPKEAEATREALVEHDYDGDPRFALGVHGTLCAAMRAVVSAPAMAAETIPHEGELRFAIELQGQPRPDPGIEYAALRALVMKRLADADCTARGVSKAMAARLPDDADHRAYKQTGRVAELHAERELVYKAYAVHETDDEAFAQLVACLDNRAREDVQTLQVVVWCLGRHDHKAAIQTLLDVLADPDCPYLHGIAQRSLQRLCTGSELISIVASDRAHAHWVSVTKPLPALEEAEAWAKRDAGSFFWEKRLRVARRLAASGDWPYLLAELAEDEVLPVQLAATAKPSEPSGGGAG